MEARELERFRKKEERGAEKCQDPFRDLKHITHAEGAWRPACTLVC